MAELIESLSKLDLGRALLSIALFIGCLGFVAVIFRSIEIPIRIYLDKRKKNAATSSLEIEEKGFESK